MLEIRNADGKLIAMLDAQTNTLIIKLKGCETRITLRPDATYKITNTKVAA
jgi:hypothetical protein